MRKDKHSRGNPRIFCRTERGGFINRKRVTGKSFLTDKGTAIIPIERIEGRILLLAGKMDESWNSVLSVRFLKTRLEENPFLTEIPR